jgi:DNA-directed RNA polymerase specialized sigma24 family protein
MKRKGLNRLIHKAIDKLDYADRELINELYFNCASVNKLSKKYGTTPSTIRYRRAKALERLKEIVEGEIKKQKTKELLE